MNAKMMAAVMLCAGVVLIGCGSGGAVPAPRTLPPNTVVVPQDLSAACTGGLVGLRAYMDARDVALDGEAKDEIQELTSPAYDVCSVEEWQRFQNNELLPWARLLQAAAS